MGDVYLYIYDLSMGMARLLSQTIVGKHFEGIWHTGVVVYGVEHYFCQEGICTCVPGSLQTGQLIERKLMGKCSFNREDFQRYIESLSKSLFKPGSYELLRHNCNTFSSHVVRHITGKEIPSYITNLPSDFLSTPLGQTFSGVLEAPAIIADPIGSQVHVANKVLHRRILPSSLKPVLYDEPLSNDFSEEELRNMFAGATGLASQWANCALRNLLKLRSPNLKSEEVPCEALSLLKFNRWASFPQCEAICEVFRLAIWRCPELILNFLTDPNKSFCDFAAAFPSPSGQVSPSRYLDLDASKSRLLCNFFALCYDWDISHLPFIPLEPVGALCLRLINVDEDKKSLKTPEHEMAGLALVVNFAMCPLTSESEAMEVAAALFHLLSVRKCFKHPNSALYALKAICALVESFSSLADLAKTLEIVHFVPGLASQAQDIKEEASTVKSISEEVVKRLMA